jgi:hypothetical protein
MTNAAASTALRITHPHHARQLVPDVFRHLGDHGVT